MPRATGDYSLERTTIFYLSHIRRMIYDIPSTVGGTHGALSTLHANDDMRARSVTGKNMTGITASQPGVRPPGPSRQRLRLAALPGDGRSTATTTPPWDRHYPRRQEDTCGVSALTPRLRAIQWPPNFPTLTNMNLSRIREAGWPSTLPLPEPLGQPRM
jgi:hypothetical protein